MKIIDVEDVRPWLRAMRYCLFAIAIVAMTAVDIHLGYDDSKVTSKTSEYWLPERYEMAPALPLKFASRLDPNSFKKAFSGHKVYVCLEQDKAKYFVDLNDIAFIQDNSPNFELVIGSKVIGVDTSTPGKVTYRFERSWPRIIIFGVIVGTLEGFLLGLAATIALYILAYAAWLCHFIVAKIVNNRASPAKEP